MPRLSGQSKRGSFHSAIGGVVTGSSGLTTNLVVPAGTIWKGVISFWGEVNATSIPPAIVANDGTQFIYLTAQQNAGASGKAGFSQYVELNAGTWALTGFSGFNGSSNNVAYAGNAWYK